MTRFKRFFAGFLFLFLAIGLAATSLAEQKKIPDYSLTPRKDVPVELTWKVEDLYPNAEAWQKDKEALRGLVAQIDERAKDWTGSPQALFGLLDLSAGINLKFQRLYIYASLQSDAEMSNSLYQAMQGEIQALSADVGVKLAFINEDLLKMNEETLRGYFFQEPRLAPYRFFVENVLRSRSHIPPAEQQKVISLTGLFAGAPQQAAGLLNNVDIPAPEVTLSDGTKVTLTQANFVKYRASKNPADRELVMSAFWTNHRRYENTLAALFDGGMKQHLFAARMGKFQDCLEARLFGDNIDPAVYYQLIKSVKENLAPLHRYLKLRKELLGLEKYRYGDIYASAVKAVDKTYTFEEARDIILGALRPLGPAYAAGLEKAFRDRWIDIYPNKDKQSGAYSNSVFGVHPFIKMNYYGEYYDVSTLAHELGHSLHSELANGAQPFATADYPTFLAEIASTFNENLLLEYLLKTETDDLFKLYLLDSYLDQVRGSIYHQTMFADFELAMHRRVEEGQSLTPDWLDKTYLDTVRAYYGHDKGVVDVDEYLSDNWSNIPHYFLNFYLFQYSTGLIASMALADNALSQGQPAVDRYLDMLKAGGNGYPIDLLKKAGVDMTTDAPTKAALKRFDSLVGEMEIIAARLKAQKKI